jgi:hypothetical protein
MRNPGSDYKQVKKDRMDNPEKHKTARRKVYAEHKIKKICTKCSADALDDSNWCEKHRFRSRSASRNYEKRRRNESRLRRTESASHG